MNSINYGAYEPYNHHQAEAEIRQWAQEYAEEKQNGAPMATLESYLNDMIDETQQCIQSREDEQEVLGDETSQEEYDNHQARIQVLENNISAFRLELQHLHQQAGTHVGAGDGFDSEDPSAGADFGPHPLPAKPNVPFPGGHFQPHAAAAPPPATANQMHHPSMGSASHPMHPATTTSTAHPTHPAALTSHPMNPTSGAQSFIPQHPASAAQSFIPQHSSHPAYGHGLEDDGGEQDMDLGQDDY